MIDRRSIDLAQPAQPVWRLMSLSSSGLEITTKKNEGAEAARCRTSFRSRNHQPAGTCEQLACLCSGSGRRQVLWLHQRKQIRTE